MRFVNTFALNQADATQTTQISNPVDVTSAVACSVVGIAAGATITGTLKVQASNDEINPTNWVDIPSATVSVAGAGATLIAKFDLSYQFIRIVYTKTTSAAGAVITAVVKTVGF